MGQALKAAWRIWKLYFKGARKNNLALNWGKCHFMVTEGIVIGHKISTASLEVDQAKISTIKTLMSRTTVTCLRSFLGHARFYRRFIKDVSKIARPLCRLLEKDAKFDLMKLAELHLKISRLD